MRQIFEDLSRAGWNFIHTAKLAISRLPGPMRRLLVFVIGFSMLAIGIALIFLPGPALLVIPAALAILAIEYPWARRLLRIFRERIMDKLGDRFLGPRSKQRKPGESL
jgi:tellurite resistance protein TerC